MSYNIIQSIEVGRRRQAKIKRACKLIGIKIRIDDLYAIAINGARANQITDD